MVSRSGRGQSADGAEAPIARRNRAVGQRGRKSDTTLAITASTSISKCSPPDSGSVRAAIAAGRYPGWGGGSTAAPKRASASVSPSVAQSRPLRLGGEHQPARGNHRQPGSQAPMAAYFGAVHIKVVATVPAMNLAVPLLPRLHFHFGNPSFASN